ncbi:hypothetical protein K440DRAFT_620540 [Wilcoxina mikolae CBS 423.85]|nr:hypothetical protein K440DRAFT_620531 [Wilcoxina mikolae CBS 423.85]KAF8241944.1 hypothetical protein K440DRAFT_620540 [Wilcoxina mikolae CBS 423.85]
MDCENRRMNATDRVSCGATNKPDMVRFYGIYCGKVTMHPAALLLAKIRDSESKRWNTRVAGRLYCDFTTVDMLHMCRSTRD